METMRAPLTRMIGIALLGCVSFAKGGAPVQDVQPSGVFPLSEGTSWTYSGIVRWFNFSAVKVSETRVTWTTRVKRVKRVTRHQHLKAAVINGFPWELDWSDGHLPPTDSLLLASDAGEYYVMPIEDVKGGLKRLADSTDSLQDLIDPDDILLRLPLVKGKKFCGDSEQETREDDMYCWVVSSVNQISLLNVKGLEPKRYQVYELRFKTNTDTELQFLPGVGLIGYQYHHHGSVADTELKLVALHLGDGKMTLTHRE